MFSKSFTPSSIVLVKRLNCSHFCSLKATRQHRWTSTSRGCSLIVGRQSQTSTKSASGWSYQLEFVKLTIHQANNPLGPARSHLKLDFSISEVILSWAVRLTLQSCQGLAVPLALSWRKPWLRQSRLFLLFSFPFSSPVIEMCNKILQQQQLCLKTY